MKNLLNIKEINKNISTSMEELKIKYTNLNTELLTEEMLIKINKDFNNFDSISCESNGHFVINGMQIFYSMYFDVVRTYSEKTNKYTSQKFNPFYLELYLYESSYEQKPNFITEVGKKRNKKKTEKIIKNKPTQTIQENKI